MRRSFALFFVLLITAPSLIADTINVPGDYPTIQGAISAAINGDTVLVEPGTYIENISFLGKAITVESTDGPTTTVIDGGSPMNPNYGSVVTFMNSEGPDSIIKGFTLCNGKAFITSTGHRLGGGIYCYKASPVIIDNIISENYSDSGGGIYCLGPNCNPHISNCLITNNFTNQGFAGGGVELRISDAHIENCTISGHSNGGGIAIWLECSPIIRNNVIQNNVNYNCGGGIRCSSSPIPLIEGNIITNNSAQQGGGIQLTNGIIRNNVISYNTAKYTTGSGKVSGYGGGLDLLNGDNRLEGNLIAYNKAMCFGGGVRCYSARFSNNIICYNVAGGGTTFDACGGGIYITYNDKYTFKNCVIYKNEAFDNGGGIYCSEYCDVILRNLTITQNTSNKGKGIYGQDGSSISVVNSILWNDLNDDIFMEAGNPNLSYCNTMSSLPGTGNISANPQFVDSVNDDYHLQYFSPCRNTGDNSWVLGSDDFEGDVRIAAGVVDIGADEFYTHLYYTGNASPGDKITGKLIGLPRTTPVGLFFGSGIMEPSIPTMWGQFHLQSPLLLLPLPTIPSNGVLEIPATVPLTPTAPYDIPMQALIGLNADSLTNLEVLEVR